MTMWIAHATNTILASPLGVVTASAARGQAKTGNALVWLVTAAIVIGVVVGGLALATRAAHRRRTNSHAGLFAGLCQHHKLDRNRRNLLKALGQAHRVRYAARVFLDPTLFDPKRLPRGLRSREQEILALRNQLFVAADTTPPLQRHG